MTRKRNKKISAQKYLCLQCDPDAVTAEHLVPEHPQSGRTCHCLIWVIAQQQHIPSLFVTSPVFP